MAEDLQHQDRVPDFTQRFVGAVEAVTAYNLKYTGADGAFKLVISSLANTDGVVPAPEVAEDEAAMGRDLITIIQAAELAEMGIGIFPQLISSGKGERLIAGFGMEVPGNLPPTLNMLVVDTGKFGETLGKIRSTDEQEGRLIGCLETILEASADSIRQGYGGDFEDEGIQQRARDAADNQLRVFTELRPVLVRNGFDSLKNYDALREYAARHEAGTLVDYIDAEDHHLWRKVSWEFGPSNWHMGDNAMALFELWQEAFEYLKTLRNRPEPSPIYDELFFKVRRDFDTSRDVVGVESTQHWALWQRRLAMEYLNGVWEQDFQIENNFYLAERVEKEGYSPAVFDPTDEAPKEPPIPEDPGLRWWQAQWRVPFQPPE